MPCWLPPLIVAPFIGSFAGVIIRRLPAGRPVALARSACETCGQGLGVLDLVPLASHMALGGVCRHCGARVSRFHPAVELAALAIAMWAVAAEPCGPRLWADCGLGWTLLVLGWIDIDHFRLPDALTLPLILAGLAEMLLLQPEAMLDRAGGAAVGYFAFRAIGVAYRALRGREGLGAGDAKLLSAAGAWVGAGALPTVVLAAALLGLGSAVALRLSGGKVRAGTPLPFGPPLALAIWLVRLYGTGPIRI